MSDIGIKLTTFGTVTDKPVVTISKKETDCIIIPPKTTCDNLTVKTNFGTVPANSEVKMEEGEDFSSCAPKVAGEVAASCANLMVKHEIKGVLVNSAKILGSSIEISGKASVKAFAGKALPAAVTVVNYGIALYDSYGAYQKIADKDVSLKSKSFALATVGLDVVTIVAHHKGNGKIAAAASVVSIGTSLASDFLKHK